MRFILERYAFHSRVPLQGLVFGNLVSLTLDVNAADSRDFGSLPRIISKELTSSMFIRPLASYCLL